MADRLELRGREVWCLEADGREYVLARIRDDLTVDEWLERYGRG